MKNKDSLKITALYERLSKDDDSSNWYTGKSL